MGKKDRQKAIEQIIETYQVETQEELAKYLVHDGFLVTQATVSRDINEMHLKKKQGKNGRQYYIKPVSFQEKAQDKTRFFSVFQEGFVHAEAAGNILVIKTIAGMAMAVAASLDSLNISELVGSIAGDDTIMCVTKTNEDAKQLRQYLMEIAHK